ncbi:interferon-inducible GTPase-domain-containing protein [Suillus spraguei]|nr:interferon-inducible GTPase-domain-containing protein [Suillus spraguei]
MLQSAITVPNKIPAPVAAVAPYLVIALLGARKALNAAKGNVEDEETASRTAKRTTENAWRHQEESERAVAEAADALQRAEEARLDPASSAAHGPSQKDIARMKARHHYSPDFLHLAVIGSSGSGKSSFINAVHGLPSDDPIAAPMGTVETTAMVTRHTDPCPTSLGRILWYDFPGAGTQNMPDWQYFNKSGLYIFDCIILLIEIRFLNSDLAILWACEQFTNIEVFIARQTSTSITWRWRGCHEGSTSFKLTMRHCTPLPNMYM